MVKVAVGTCGETYPEPEHAKARRFPFFEVQKISRRREYRSPPGFSNKRIANNSYTLPPSWRRSRHPKQNKFCFGEEEQRNE